MRCDCKIPDCLCQQSESPAKRVRKYVEPHPCMSCGEETTNPSFCSNACSSNVWSVELQAEIASWVNGEIQMSNSKGQLRSCAKKFLLKEAGHACTRCGWNKKNPKTGKPILCIDHVDGDWKNNFRNNLVVLCYNCHSLTPTFGGLNRGVAPNPRSVFSRKVWKVDAQEPVMVLDGGIAV